MEGRDGIYVYFAVHNLAEQWRTPMKPVNHNMPTGTTISFAKKCAFTVKRVYTFTHRTNSESLYQCLCYTSHPVKVCCTLSNASNKWVKNNDCLKSVNKNLLEDWMQDAIWLDGRSKSTEDETERMCSSQLMDSLNASVYIFLIWCQCSGNDIEISSMFF